MADKADITPELLRQLIEVRDGRYFWKARPRSMFSSDLTHAMWNGRFPGTELLNKIGSKGYVFVKVLQVTLSGHRVIWALHHGEWPTQQIDHIDGNRANNSIENLRDVPPSENSRNIKLPTTNKSGAMGVIWSPRRNKWRAFIKANNIHKDLGFFSNFDDAVVARKSAEKSLGFHQNHGRRA